MQRCTVEAVANVAGRAELLSAALSLLAFLCFTAACPRAGRSVGSKKRLSMIVATCIFFVLSTLAKETGFTVLGAFWAYDLLYSGELLERLRTKCVCCCSSGRASDAERESNEEKNRKKVSRDRIFARGSNTCGANGSNDKGVSSPVSPACKEGTAFWRAILSRHIPLLLCAAGYLASRRSLSHRFSPEISARDNHLALEPDRVTRVLSYASLHGRYAGLLVYPTVCTLIYRLLFAHSFARNDLN